MSAFKARTWIFQGDPNRFRIDDYLAMRPQRLTWGARQRRVEMRPGDQVFLWRSQGRRGRASAGIVAECSIVDGPALRPEELEAGPFWIDRSDFLPDELRVLLGLGRVVGKEQTLLRTDLKTDALLAGMDILVRPQGTNFLLTASQAERLNERWNEHWLRHGRA